MPRRLWAALYFADILLFAIIYSKNNKIHFIHIVYEQWSVSDISDLGLVYIVYRYIMLIIATKN